MIADYGTLTLVHFARTRVISIIPGDASERGKYSALRGRGCRLMTIRWARPRIFAAISAGSLWAFQSTVQLDCWKYSQIRRVKIRPLRVAVFRIRKSLLHWNVICATQGKFSMVHMKCTVLVFETILYRFAILDFVCCFVCLKSIALGSWIENGTGKYLFRILFSVLRFFNIGFLKIPSFFPTHKSHLMDRICKYQEISNLASTPTNLNNIKF